MDGQTRYSNAFDPLSAHHGERLCKAFITPHLYRILRTCLFIQTSAKQEQEKSPKVI